jgi:hypothetical protein
MKETTVEMGDVVKKMRDHVPERLFWNHVFLAANMAISAMYKGTAVQTVVLLSQWNVGQCKILLKNKRY